MNTSYTYISDLKDTIDQISHDVIEQVINILHDARVEQRNIFVMGNGGSASTSTHMACDLSKNTRKPGWPNFKVIGLADNMAIFSALANDEGYENVFAQQLATFVQPKDVVIAISASGNSKNVLNAVEVAKANQAVTIGFTGFDGGKLAGMVDIDLHVPSHCIEHVEDIHLMLEHLIASALRDMAVVDPALMAGGAVNKRLDC